MSAIKYIGSLKDFVAKGEISSETSIFRLQYQFTVVFLIAASVLLSASEFFGDPILCITDLPKNVIQTYCWISSTFTIGDYGQREEYGFAVPHPGVMPPMQGLDAKENKWRFHSYYQWVVFFLFFLATLSYIPKYIWSISECGLMESIGSGLRGGLFKEEDVKERKRCVVEYIVTHIKMHNDYVFKYWFCEFLALLNVVGQLFLIDVFLDGEFMKYGLKVLDHSEMDPEERMDPMIYIFPRMTKCHFRQFGPSGTPELKDSLCLLPLNILNEKTFIVIWFWYIILCVLLSFLITYRLCLLFLPTLRPRVMYYHNKVAPLEALTTFCNKTSIGDWWIMYVVSKNIDPMIYRDIMLRLAKEIETNASNNAFSPSREGLHTSAV